MQAEERKEIEQNSLEKWIRSTWGKMSQRSLYTYVFIGGLIILAILAWNWWSGAKAGQRANMWMDLEQLDTPEKLRKFADSHRGETVGEIAKLRLARVNVGPEGLMKLGTRDAEQRRQALTSLVEGRNLYLEVAPQLKNEKSFQVEAYLGAAKSEETLIGATLPDKPGEILGDADKALGHYEKALALMGETEEAKKLKEYVANFKASKDKIIKDYTDFYTSMKPLEPIKPLDPIKSEEPKKDEPKKEETKKDEVKKDEPKKEEAKKEEAKKDEAKKDEVKKDEVKKEEKK